MKSVYLVAFSHGGGVPGRIETLQSQQVQLGVRVVSDFMHNLKKGELFIKLQLNKKLLNKVI